MIYKYSNVFNYWICPASSMNFLALTGMKRTSELLQSLGLKSTQSPGKPPVPPVDTAQDQTLDPGKPPALRGIAAQKPNDSIDKDIDNPSGLADE